MKFTVETKGHYDFVNITEQVADAVAESGMSEGIATMFILGTTAAVTTMEWEEGIKKDLIELWEKLVPETADYHHHQRWGDHNGAAHMKSALMGASLTIPVEKGQLVLGTWQQIVLIDFDERPRKREVIVKVIKS